MDVFLIAGLVLGSVAIATGQEIQTPKAVVESPKYSRQIRMEIVEDLRSLRAINKATVTALQSAKELPPGYAAEAGRAIRKHALRLQADLRLPELDENEARTAPPPLPDTDRESLTAVCTVINEFITNSVFVAAGVVNVTNGTKARLELEAIIRLAEHLSSVPEEAPR